MGLWSRIAQLVNTHRQTHRRSRRVEKDALRRCRFESMEPRRMLSAEEEGVLAGRLRAIPWIVKHSGIHLPAPASK